MPSPSHRLRTLSSWRALHRTTFDQVKGTLRAHFARCNCLGGSLDPSQPSAVALPGRQRSGLAQAREVAHVGVSLSLEGSRQVRARKRGGHHTRSAEEQACLDALAALLRSDVAGAGRCLTRVSTLSLASRLLPAAQALARAADMALSSDAAGIGAEVDFVLSPACLLGHCEGVAEAGACQSPTCQHRCHAP
jgi:hypothetical protein